MVMSFYYSEPDDQEVQTLEAEQAIIQNAQITKALAEKPKFSTLAIVFLVGALSFAVALSYNNFAQALIARYSFGDDGITATFINLIVFTGVAVGILYLLWKQNPRIIGSAVL